jgi:hypothetical protein
MSYSRCRSANAANLRSRDPDRRCEDMHEGWRGAVAPEGEAPNACGMWCVTGAPPVPGGSGFLDGLPREVRAHMTQLLGPEGWAAMAGTGRGGAAAAREAALLGLGELVVPAGWGCKRLDEATAIARFSSVTFRSLAHPGHVSEHLSGQEAWLGALHISHAGWDVMAALLGALLDSSALPHLALLGLPDKHHELPDLPALLDARPRLHLALQTLQLDGRLAPGIADRISSFVGKLAVGGSGPVFGALSSVGGLRVDRGWIGMRLPALARVGMDGLELHAVHDASLDGLKGLVSLEGHLRVTDCPALQTLRGLEGLTHVGTYVQLERNPALVTLLGLGGLASLGGSLAVRECPVLERMSGLGSLARVGANVYVGHNPALASLEGLGSLASVGGGVTVRANPALASLEGLGSLASVGGGVTVAANPALASLEGLGSLASVGGGVTVAANPALASLEGLGSLASIGRSLTVAKCPALRSLGGLNALASIGDCLEVGDCRTLQSMAGLASLAHVGGDVRLSNNFALTSLAGLGGLALLGGSLVLTGCPTLESVRGLGPPPRKDVE